MIDVKKIDTKTSDGYLVSSETGERIVFYQCDPEKNTECEKRACKNLFCSKTTDPRFKKDDGHAFYASFKSFSGGQPVFDWEECSI